MGPMLLVEVEAGADPRFTLRRISRGNEDAPSDNDETDTITIRRFNQAPSTPVGQPVVCDGGVLLSASAFADPDGDAQQGAQWQVADSCSDFASPRVDRWRQARNEYMGADTQAGDDLTHETVAELVAGSAACWRVRYRDASLGWSGWSDPLALTVPACD